MTRNRPFRLALLGGLTITAFCFAVSQQPRRSTSTVEQGVPPSRTPSSSVPIGIPGTTTGRRPGTHRTTSTNHREPCWQVAGISKAAMQQRKTIAQQFRQEVEGVCANATLTPAQKQQRIRQIHQQERQQLQGIITPQQQEAMRACRQQRGGAVGGGGHLGGHGAGPCGTLPGIVSRENESEVNEEPPDN